MKNLLLICTILCCNYTGAQTLALTAYATCDTLSTTPGSVTAVGSGGVAPYTYNWSIAGDSSHLAHINNLSNGTYYITVYDAGGDSVVKSVAVNCAPSPIFVSGSNGCDSVSGTGGYVYVSVAGGTSPYQYSWSNGSTNANQHYLPNGTYTVTITDAGLKTATTAITINCSVLPLSVTVRAVCDTTNGTKGNAIADIVGGTPPYSYHWSLTDSAVSSAHIYNLSNGIYSITVYDTNGDSAISSVTINCGYLPFNVSATSYCDSTHSNGGVSVAVAYGGTYPYTYTWSDGNNAYYNSYMASGGYTVTATDAMGVTATTSITISCSSAYCKADFVWFSDSTNPHAVIISNMSFGVKQEWDMGDSTIITGPIGSHVYKNPGVYKVCLNVSDSVHQCADSKCMNLTVSKLSSAIYSINIVRPKPTGLDNFAGAVLNFSLYPNPVSETFTIEMGMNTPVTIQMINMLGQMVYSNRGSTGGKVTIDVSILPKGIYMVQLLDNYAVIGRQRLVVQ